MEHLLAFIRRQKLMVLACHTPEEVWVANVYVGVDERGTISFMSPEDTKHSQMILKNPSVAFSFVWFDEQNPKNRKGVQGLGVCRLAETDEEITQGLKLHHQNFPIFGERSVEWIRHNEWGARVWVLNPTSIKYWDDERYGAEETQEFIFPEK